MKTEEEKKVKMQILQVVFLNFILTLELLYPRCVRCTFHRSVPQFPSLQNKTFLIFQGCSEDNSIFERALALSMKDIIICLLLSCVVKRTSIRNNLGPQCYKNNCIHLFNLSFTLPHICLFYYCLSWSGQIGWKHSQTGWHGN